MSRDQGPQVSRFAPLRPSRSREYPYAVSRYSLYSRRRRLEQLAGYGLAFAIGAGLALALVAWWS